MPPHLRAETSSALKWVDIAPYDEAAARACVEALLRNDRRFEAREFLEAWRVRYEREIGAVSAETRSLEHSLVSRPVSSSSNVLPPARPDTAPLRKIGRASC